MSKELSTRLTLPGLEKLRKAMSKLGRVKIGIPASDTADGGVPQAMIAAVHEFGLPDQGIPERPFLRPAVRENTDAYLAIVRKRLPLFNRGQLSALQLLTLLGERAKADVQSYIALPTTAFAPLAEATILRKGSSKPLIDSGNMRQSITYVPEPK